MSEEVTLNKEVEMNVQIDDVTCDCGKDLEFSVTVDAYQDLKISVETHVCDKEDEE